MDKIEIRWREKGVLFDMEYDEEVHGNIERFENDDKYYVFVHTKDPNYPKYNTVTTYAKYIKDKQQSQ